MKLTKEPDDLEAVVERVRDWLSRGNPTGGMNLPSHDGKTPSIRADLRLVFEVFEDVREGWAREVRNIEELEARVAAYEAPGGWRALADRDARRVLGDPSQGVFGTVTDGLMRFAPPDDAGRTALANKEDR